MVAMGSEIRQHDRAALSDSQEIAGSREQEVLELQKELTVTQLRVQRLAENMDAAERESRANLDMLVSCQASRLSFQTEASEQRQHVQFLTGSLLAAEKSVAVLQSRVEAAEQAEKKSRLCNIQIMDKMREVSVQRDDARTRMLRSICLSV